MKYEIDKTSMNLEYKIYFYIFFKDLWVTKGATVF